MSETTKREVDEVIPGVSQAYSALLSRHGRGIHTSTGSFFNHTFFGRDASTTAKFMVDLDPSTAHDVIIALARLQGVTFHKRTQEEPGRIHHEWRDFTSWHGTFKEKLLLFPWRYLWGGNRRLLLTYFSVDSTASYIRLVHKYATHIDISILAQEIVDKSGETITIGESITRAANWVISQMTEDGFIKTRRQNPFSLPFQIYQDSVTAYARTDGTLAKYHDYIGYVESQAFAADALYDICQLLPKSVDYQKWHKARHSAEGALFDGYWLKDGFFAGGIDTLGQIDRHNIAAGWSLNTSSWDTLNEQEKSKKIAAIVKRLFSSEFLTAVGLRSRAYSQLPILEDVVEYHGRQTVWPMFTFMVIEGLRRHRLYSLAEQLENRLINGLNVNKQFSEYFIIDGSGTLFLESKKVKQSLNAQMYIEKNIAFTVVPAFVLAHRVKHPPQKKKQENWQQKLEEEVLADIPAVVRVNPENAQDTVKNIRRVRLRRFKANVKTAFYFAKESIKS